MLFGVFMFRHVNLLQTWTYPSDHTGQVLADVFIDIRYFGTIMDCLQEPQTGLQIDTLHFTRLPNALKGKKFSAGGTQSVSQVQQSRGRGN